MGNEQSSSGGDPEYTADDTRGIVTVSSSAGGEEAAGERAAALNKLPKRVKPFLEACLTNRLADIQIPVPTLKAGLDGTTLDPMLGRLQHKLKYNADTTAKIQDSLVSEIHAVRARSQVLEQASSNQTAMLSKMEKISIEISNIKLTMESFHRRTEKLVVSMEKVNGLFPEKWRLPALEEELQRLNVDLTLTRLDDTASAEGSIAGSISSSDGQQQLR